LIICSYSEPRNKGNTLYSFLNANIVLEIIYDLVYDISNEKTIGKEVEINEL
jgi:hypothetical protein